MDKCFFCQRTAVEGVDDVTRRDGELAHTMCLNYIRDSYELLRGWYEKAGQDASQPVG